MKQDQEKKFIFMEIIMILGIGLLLILNYLGPKDTFGKQIIKFQNQ